MLKFVVSEDRNWLSLIDYEEEFERKQIDISLTRKIHNHYFHPLVKKKHWDGAICFVDKRLPIWRVPSGLWSEVYQICEKYKIEVEINGLERIIDNSFTLEKYTEWCNKFFKGGVGGDPEKMPRDYQIETAWKIIKFKLSVSEVATSSGKTLIAFMVMAYLKEVLKVKKFLMVVPNTNLVIQGSEDFEEYGLEKLEDCEIQQIHGSNKKKISGGLMIGTYQSLVKMDPEFFDDVEAVFVDECHQAQSASIKKVVALCKDSKWRFGLSGTLANKNTAEYLTIQQFLGPLIMEISPKFLFDNKYATPVSIKIVKMDWMDEEVKEKLATLKETKNEMEGNELFNLERKLVVNSDKRLNYIINFVLKTSKNSLLLFQSVGEGYGKRIYDGIREGSNDREVYYIDGDTAPDKRDIFTKRMEEGINKVMVASFGTMSTGISVKNIHNIFLIESYKSEVLIKQSLGRGMRLFDGKEKVNIIDFVDDFSFGGKDNYLLKHSKERIEIYKKEQFEYKIYEIKI
jgi:superfamily II DNA or RNA helicase